MAVAIGPVLPRWKCRRPISAMREWIGEGDPKPIRMFWSWTGPGFEIFMNAAYDRWRAENPDAGEPPWSYYDDAVVEHFLEQNRQRSLASLDDPETQA